MKLNLKHLKKLAQAAIDKTIPPNKPSPNDICFCGHKRKQHPIKADPGSAYLFLDGIFCNKYWHNPYGNAHELSAMHGVLTPEIVLEMISKIEKI